MKSFKVLSIILIISLLSFLNICWAMESHSEDYYQNESKASYKIVVYEANYVVQLLGKILKGGPGGILQYREIHSISNKYSANVSLDAQIISAGVGFDVTFRQDKWFSYEREISEGHMGTLELKYHYKATRFYILKKNIFRKWKVIGKGVAYKWQMAEFVYSEQRE